MRILAVLLVLSLAACLTPRAQHYYDACLESGRNVGECKMMANEFDVRVLGAAGEAFRRAGTPRQRQVICSTTYLGSTASTVCH